MRSGSIRALLVLSLLSAGLLGCGGGGEASSSEGSAHAGGEHAHPGHGHAGHGQGHGHAAHGQGHGQGHGHHDHSSPEALGPLMRELFAEMQGLRGALASEDAAAAATHGRAIAVACDDQDVHDLDPARFGPRFGEIDRELHVAAAELAEVAEAGDLIAARERYTRTLSACTSCHAQAPSAGHVDLAPLAP